MKHLIMNEDEDGVEPWCDAKSPPRSQCVPNVDESDCVECLRMLGNVGAHAAMRCVAVEQGSDARETSQERDHAIATLRKFEKVLQGRSLFICTHCFRLLPITESAITVGTMSWCNDCQEVKAT